MEAAITIPIVLTAAGILISLHFAVTSDLRASIASLTKERDDLEVKNLKAEQDREQAWKENLDLSRDSLNLYNENRKLREEIAILKGVRGAQPSDSQPA